MEVFYNFFKIEFCIFSLTNLGLLEQGAINVGSASGLSVAGQLNQSFGSTPLSSHAPTSISISQPPAVHHLPPSQTSSVISPDVHGGTGAVVNRSASLLNPSLFSPLTSSQTTMARTNPVAPTAPPQHPRITQQPHSAPLLQPFPLPTASPSPPYGTPLLQPFPPPNPSPSLASAPVYSPVLSREKVRDALLRLVEVCCNSNLCTFHDLSLLALRVKFCDELS